MTQPEVLSINGPVGTLETIFLPSQTAPQGVAVINHPNPLQGGSREIGRASCRERV